MTEIRMKAATRIAKRTFVFAVLFVVFGVGIYVWWRYFAPRPILSAPPADVLAAIQSATDVERLRAAALMLAHQRGVDGEFITDMMSYLVLVVTCVSLMASVALVSCAKGMLKAQRNEGTSQRG